ncbi:MAG TPA: ATP-binding protein, partial [Myxococcales bacterium]|nr:ATP-binding protein [Myxococcales bacterium]
ELVGHLVSELLPGGPEVRDVFRDALQNRRRESLTLESGDRWLRVTCDPLKDGPGAVAIFTDVTESHRAQEERENGAKERKRLEEELRRKLDELQLNDRRKDEFLAMLAHELRNPLAAITAGLQALGEVGSMAPQPVKLRSIILRQVGVLTRLVDDLLDVSRITRGKVELRRAPLDVVDAVRNAVFTVRQAIDERRHTLELVLPAEPVWVHGDTTRIEQVVWNLLSNAAKYTEPGGRIRVSLERRGTDAVLRVRDTGIGIPPPMLEGIFELFAQLDQSAARTRGGLGVGLTLVRSLVEMHGGSVRARSDGAGKGTEFEVRLPMLAEAPAPSPVREDTLLKAERARLLLIEDNPDIGETLRDLLEILGHRVDLASDGLRGVQMALALKPDAALVDIGLPGIDGYEVAQRLRADPVGREMLLVALTGYGRPEDRERALEAGFDAHLVKPVDPEDLTSLIGELSARRREMGATR